MCWSSASALLSTASASSAAHSARWSTDYFAMRDAQWHGDKSWDTWINSDINNAKLLPFGRIDPRL